MNKLIYVAVPYLFLMFLAFAIADGIHAAIKRAKLTRIAPLSPHTHDCVDHPQLTCPACAWSERHKAQGQSLTEVCVMLAVLLVLVAGAGHFRVEVTRRAT